MKGKKPIFLIVLLFIAIQAIAIIRNYTSDYFNFFWFCDFVPFFFAIAFLIPNLHFAKGLINIGLIPQIVFLGIFVYNLSSGGTLLFTIPEGMTLFYGVSSVVLHLSTIVALALTYRVKPTKETLMYSLLALVVMYISIIAFTSSNQYINYVYSGETIIPFSIPYYTAFWIPLVFAVVVFPTHLIQIILYKKFNQNKINS